jgi:O-acetyl-ADP-ribose deacetylase (regulator of RNase III)/uncharacterized protein YwgA
MCRSRAVKVLIGDIFESKAQTLVNTVNCVGVMGKGIALRFRERFPDMYEDYVLRCKAREVKLGQPYLYRRLIPPWIVNFPTKYHWRDRSSLEAIVRGTEYLAKHSREWGIESLAVPPLGCGEGQLDWRVVGPTLYRHLSQLPIPVELYAPYGTPETELLPAFLEGTIARIDDDVEWATPHRLEPGLVAIVAILARIEREPYHWPIGRTMFQKIAYFATESGIPTGLTYQRSSFGPFAVNLKRATARLQNHLLIRERRLGRGYVVQVGPTFQDAWHAYERDLTKWQPTIDKLSDLFARMDTNKAEVAATVHFAARSLAEKYCRRPSEREVFDEVMNWKRRRRPSLKEADVALAIRNLSALGWLDVSPSGDLLVDEEALLEA